MFGVSYLVGSQPGTKSYTMNAADLRENLRSIRNGKLYSDYMIATIHAHEGKWVAQKFPYEDETPDYLIELARKSIDNGADAFLGHGPHALRGIEIYRGKPIFYGLGQLIRQSDWRYTGIGEYRMLSADPLTTELTPAEVAKQTMERRDVRGESMYESIIATLRYEGGNLREIRLHPMDLGYDRPLSQVGYPRTAPPEMARRILQHLQAVSKEFNTVIDIQGTVGVIRVDAVAGAPSRQP
jgi:poly-gamma-glutamate synthesis protein (capsule biosynthesis protein)